MGSMRFDIDDVIELDEQIAIAGAVTSGEVRADDLFNYLFAVAIASHK